MRTANGFQYKGRATDIWNNIPKIVLKEEKHFHLPLSLLNCGVIFIILCSALSIKAQLCTMFLGTAMQN